jgi:hypothetical protein
METIDKIEGKGHVWKIFKKIGEVAALSALMAFLNPENSNAGDLNGLNDMRDAVSSQSEMGTKSTMERLQTEIVQRENSIKKLAEQEGKLIHVDGMAAREYKNKNGDVITFGINENGGTWVALTTSNNVLTYYSNGSGFPDRVIMDQEKRNINAEENKLAENLPYMFPDFTDLSVMADTYFDPIDKKIFHFKKGNIDNGFVVESLDMKTGKGADLEGSGANKVMQDVMKYYLNHLKSI